MAAQTRDLLPLLAQAVREPLRRPELLAKFPALVWEGLDPSLPASVREVLSDLAYDVDFFEAKRAVREEDASLHGHRDLEKELLSAMSKLRAAGVDV